ncbi:MAG: 6-bladed beta-propeller [Phycisphaera sp.]|nr:6-bladed beta-propeller [Phycisphaera sp.]
MTNTAGAMGVSAAATRRGFLAGGLAATLGMAWAGRVLAHEPGAAFAIEQDRGVYGPTGDDVLGHGTHKYNVVPGWGELDPHEHPIVNCHAMVQTGDGLLHTLCDGVRNNFLVYDKSGKLVRAWGTEYPGAHGLELVKEGKQEFFFVVDGGWMVRGDDGKASREQGNVTKITTDGRHIFKLGHPSTIGVYEPGQRFQPCDAAAAPNGDFYIADGYGSQWVLQYDHDGKFKRKFAGPQDPNPAARLNGAHGVSIDQRDPSNPMVVCSSRSANELKWFSMDGEHIKTVALPGAYAGQAVFKGENIYAGVCWSKQDGTGKRLANSGFVTILDKDDRVISNPGGTEPKYVDGKLQPMHQDTHTFRHVHDVCVDDEDSVYALEWNSGGCYPIKLKRI